MSRHGVDVLHIVFGGLGGHAAVVGPLTEQLQADGLRSAVVGYGPAQELASNAAAWRAADEVVLVPLGSRVDAPGLLRIARTVAGLRPRVVLCHTHKPALAAYFGMAVSTRQPRMLLVEHQALGLRKRTDDLLSALTLPLVRGVVVNQPDYQSRYPLRRVPLRATRRICVVPNGVDTTAFRPAPAGPGGGPTLGMATRLVPTKDLATLIDALALLRDRRPTVRLEIAGDGPERPRLQAQVDRLALSGSVRFLGTLHQAELVAFFQRLDVYVQSTLGETACTAVLQAAACEVPVVASDVIGVQGLVRGGLPASLVPPQDAAALAAAVGDLLDEPERRLQSGRAARRHVVQTWDVRITTDLYRRALRACDPEGPW